MTAVLPGAHGRPGSRAPPWEGVSGVDALGAHLGHRSGPCFPDRGRTGAWASVFCLPVCGHMRPPLRLPVRVEPAVVFQAARIFSVLPEHGGDLAFLHGRGTVGRLGARAPRPPVVTRRGVLAAPPRPELPMTWLLDLSCHSCVLSNTAQGQPSHLVSVPSPSTSAMSLLYECVNTVIAGESCFPGSGTGGSGPGGGARDRPAPDGRAQAPAVCCRATRRHSVRPPPSDSHTLSAGGFFRL